MKITLENKEVEDIKRNIDKYEEAYKECSKAEQALITDMVSFWRTIVDYLLCKEDLDTIFYNEHSEESI